MELEQEDLNEIARLIKAGNKSGILDNEETRLVWELKTNKFKN